MVSRIELAPWTADWAVAFEAVAQDIRDVVRAPVQVEHIGSTAVIGLESKPIIDVLVGVADIGGLAATAAALRGAGFSGADGQPPADVTFLHRQGDPPINLHLTTVGSVPWHELKAFRDTVVADAEVQTAYAALKRELAQAAGGDLDRYTAGKSAFIAKTLRTRR